MTPGINRTAELFTGPAGLSALSPEWAEILDHREHHSFFHAQAWYSSYLDALAEVPGEARFAAVREGTAPVAIVPLEPSSRRWLSLPARTLALPSHAHLPLGDIVARPGVSAEGVVAEVVTQLRVAGMAWDVLAFPNVPADSSIGALRDSTRFRLRVRPVKTNDSVECDRSYAEVSRTFSRNFRSSLAKARNKLKAEGDVQFVSASSGEDLRQGFSDFLDLEAAGWKGPTGTGSAIRLHPHLLRFYDGLLDRLSPSGRILVNVLHARGRPLAAQVCLRDDDTLNVYKLAYDESRKRISPGNMLLERVLTEAAPMGIRRVCLVGDPAWFKSWRPTSVPVFNLFVFNSTLRGQALWRLEGLRDRLGPAVRRLRRAGLGRRLAPPGP